MLKKGFILTFLMIAFQFLSISAASANTIIDGDVASIPDVVYEQKYFALSTGTIIEGDAAYIDSAVTWDLAHSPYIINDNVTIGTEGSLTVKPGVVVKFSKYKVLTVEGTLNARGTAENLIYFTDKRDDAVGGDTNNDDDATEPDAGWWSGIYINGTATMDYCIVRYAGCDNEANIYKTGTEPLTLTNSTLSDSLYDGLRICYSEGALAVSNCKFQNNKRYGVYMENIETDTYTGNGNSFINNSKAPICIDGGTLEHNITWSLEGSPYYINGNITVDQTAVLTVLPGVAVKFAKDKVLDVTGTLTAQGTPQAAIYFTDYRDDEAGGDTNGDESATEPVAGWWSGIYIRDGGDATLTNCIVRYTGSNNESSIYKTGTGSLTLSDSTVSDSLYDGLRICNSEGTSTVSNCQFQDNKRYGVFMENIETDTYTGNGNSFTNNSKAPVCIDGGTLQHNINWILEASPYYISGNIAVDENAVLTVNPGVVVKFAQSKGLTVQGTLTAKGTQLENGSDGTIYFTDYRDDEAGGDTNHDEENTKPEAGWWDGIYISYAGTATLDKCVVRYGGCYESNIYKTGTGALTLTNSTVNDSMSNGLDIRSSTGVHNISKNKIYSNKVGIYCQEANPVIGGSIANANQIYQNTDFGIKNDSYNQTINASYNWWGDATGPAHSTNPSGKGNKVSDYVDFSNFLTSVNGDPSNPNVVEFEPSTNTSLHNWTIKFNKNIYDSTFSNSSVNAQNVTVSDDNGNPVNVTFTPGSDFRSIIINAPAQGYLTGKTYTIFVKDIKPVNGNIMIKQYKMKFTVS